MRYQSLRTLGRSVGHMRNVVKALKEKNVELSAEILKALLRKMSPEEDYDVKVVCDPDEAAKCLVLRRAIDDYDLDVAKSLPICREEQNSKPNSLLDTADIVVGTPELVTVKGVVDGYMHDYEFCPGKYDDSMDLIADNANYIACVDFEVDSPFIMIIETLIARINEESDDWVKVVKTIVIYVPEQTEMSCDEVYRERKEAELERLCRMELE